MMARIAVHRLPLRIHDPQRLDLRKAVRTALVAPLALAFGLVVVHDDNVAIYGLFGSLSLLVFADFGGPPATRAGSYAATTAVGAVLITISSLASTTTAVVVAIAVAVGFAVELASVVGGAVAAARTVLLLAFVLPAVSRSGADVIPERLLGWVVGGLGALVAAVVVWPARPHRVLTEAVGSACGALADAIEHATPATSAAAAAAVDRLRSASVASTRAPAGPTYRDRAITSVVAELTWALPSAVRAGRAAEARRAGAPAASPGGAGAETGAEAGADGELVAAVARLGAAIVAALRTGADALEGDVHADLDAAVARLTTERALHLDALRRWTAATLQTPARERVLTTLDANRDLRLAAAHVQWLGAAMATFSQRRRPARAGLAALGALGRAERAHIHWGSVRLLRSVRTAVAIGLAVLVARLSRVDHAFWVVLATLAVLRTSALGTARRSLDAIVGTVLGFVVATPVMLVVRTDHPALWALLPVTLFVAAYTPDAIGFVVGQAALTVAVVVAFNLVSPEGWRTGLYRIEDVAVGIALTVVVGALVWPRGASAAVRARMVELWSRLADDLGAAFAAVAGSAPRAATPAPLPSSRLLDADARALDACHERLAEPGASAPITAAWSDLMTGAATLVDCVGRLAYERAHDYRVDATAEGGRMVVDDAGRAVSRVRALAGELGHPAGPPPAPASDAAARRRAIAGDLARAPARADVVSGVFATVWTSDFVGDVDHIVDRVIAPTAELAAAEARGWWERVR